MRRVLPLCLVVSVLLTPAGAEAQRDCIAAPGTGAVDQYCEVVPTSKGDRGTNTPGPPSSLPPGTATELEQAGADGQGLAQALGQTPTEPGKGKGEGRDRPPAPVAAAPDVPSSNPFSAVSQAVGEGSTIGGGFVAALVGAVLLMTAWAWLVYRRRPTP